MIDLRIALALLALLPGCAKVVVVPVKGTANADGVLYALPSTVIRTQVKLERSKKTGAPYGAYAPIFAGPDAEAVCESPDCTRPGEGGAKASDVSVEYLLQPGATFATYGEPDPENVFLVKFGGRTLDETLSMTWNEAGLLSAGGATSTNRVSDVVLGTLKGAASFGAKLAAGAPQGAVKKGLRCPYEPKDNAEAGDDWFLVILAKQGVGSGAPVVNYCALTKEKRAALKRDEALFTAAVVAYVRELQPLETAGAAILTSSTTAAVMDPVALLARIEAEMARITARLYVGTKKTQTWEGFLDTRPPKLDGSGDAIPSIPILLVDVTKGVCLANAELPPDSKPFPKEFSVLKADDCAKAAVVSLVLEFRPARPRQLFARIADDTSGDRSFRYRIPAQVSVQLVQGEKKLGSGVVAVAQFGTIVSLPSTRRSKSLSYDLAFVEATGALKTFKIGTTALVDAATMDALATTAGSVADARASVRKSEDELTTLTRRDALLKARDEICEIQKKYGLPCDVTPQ